MNKEKLTRAGFEPAYKYKAYTIRDPEMQTTGSLAQFLFPCIHNQSEHNQSPLSNMFTFYLIDTAPGSVPTSVPVFTVTDGTIAWDTEGPNNQPTRHIPGAERGSEGGVGLDKTATGGNAGGTRGNNGVGFGGGGDNRPGVAGTDVTSKTVDEDALQNGVFPVDGEFGEATPDKQPPQKDTGMMFLTGMLCGVTVLSVAAFVVLFVMYRQRRNMDSRIIGIPFLHR